MKVIAFVLLIVTFVVSQVEDEYYVLLSHRPTGPSGLSNINAGYLKFTQLSFEHPVRIFGDIGWLPPGWYKFAVHRINENTINCDTLGPIVNLEYGTVFELFTQYVGDSGYENFTKLSLSTTLEPNKPTSLVGRAIVASYEPTSDNSQIEHSHFKACGSILTLEAMAQKYQYYEAQNRNGLNYGVTNNYF